MIRLAVPSDVSAVARLQVEAWQAAYRKHMPDSYLDALDPSTRIAMWTAAIKDPSTLVFVAIHESLLGFCAFLSSRDADALPEVGEVAALYVDPSRWRSGVGSALLAASVESAHRRSFRTLTLWVLAENVPARAFYEARGFQTDGRTKIEELPGFSIQEVRYRRDLTPASRSIDCSPKAGS